MFNNVDPDIHVDLFSLYAMGDHSGKHYIDFLM